MILCLLEHLVERVLHTGEALGGIVVLVMDVQIIAANGLTGLLTQQVVIDKGLGGLAGKLHHHAGGSVGIHVGILAGDIVILGIDDLQEQVTGLGLASHTAFLAVIDIASGNLLAGALHQFQLHLVLNILDAHLAAATRADTVGDALDEALVLPGFGCEHCLADCGFDFFLIIADDAAISFKYSLDHILGTEMLGF